MYHARFQGTHYEIGLKWGTRLFQYGKILLDNVPFPISQERIDFAGRCRPFYEKWYPEILEENTVLSASMTERQEKILYGQLFMMWVIRKSIGVRVIRREKNMRRTTGWYFRTFSKDTVGRR